MKNGLTFYTLMDFLRSILKNNTVLATSLIVSCIPTISEASSNNDAAYFKKIEQQKYNLYEEVLKSISQSNTPEIKNNGHLTQNELDNGYRLVNCWDEAGKKYNLDPWLIFAYAQTESSLNPSAVNKNKSSIDRGIMQINSYWLPTLKKYNITTEHLFDSCVSIFIGSWIIRQNINQYGYNYNGLVAYNVGNPHDPNKKAVGQKYYAKLVKNYNAMRKKYN